MLSRVLIAGGGTGGHIFPALAMGKALKAEFPDLELLYVGALGRMEMEKVPAAGFRIEGLPIVGVPRRKTPAALCRFVWQWYRSYRMAKRIVSTFNPDVVVGVGGYASVPAMQAAQRLGIPTLIQEQNSFAGKANRMLAKRAAKVAVAYGGMERYFPQEKLVLTGNPVREELLKALPPREEACAYLGLPATTTNILVLGGSLGATRLSEAILAHASEIGRRSDVTVLLQTGATDFDKMQALANEQGASENLHLVPFIARMDYAYAAADLIVSRAGAIAISELSLIARPLILVPSPYVAEDHQTKNARVLSEVGAAILVPESESRDGLWRAIEGLLKDEKRRLVMTLSLSHLAKPSASKDLAQIIASLAKL